MINVCAMCFKSASNKNDRYFVIPGKHFVPNCYSLCDSHKNIQLDYDYFYEERDGKIINKLYDKFKNKEK